MNLRLLAVERRRAQFPGFKKPNFSTVMPISGLLLTLHSRDALNELLPILQGMPEIEPGEANDIWLPVVADTTSPKHARDLHEQLEALPQISHIDVISVAFDDTPEETSNSRHALAKHS